MKYFVALLFCYTISITNGYANTDAIFKKIVSGGNNNATLGQVIAGYKNNNHIGIRIPKRLTTYVENDNSDIVLSSVIYPNPSNQDVVFYQMDDVKSILITDIYGSVILNAYDLNTRKITLPYRGVFYINFTTNNNKIYSTRVIFN